MAAETFDPLIPDDPITYIMRRMRRSKHFRYFAQECGICKGYVPDGTDWVFCWDCNQQLLELGSDLAEIQSPAFNEREKERDLIPGVTLRWVGKEPGKGGRVRPAGGCAAVLSGAGAAAGGDALGLGA